MATFESGVDRYIKAYAVVEVFFPVNIRGLADISCYQCKFFRRNYQTCGLNGEICAYPDKFVGAFCPLDYNESEEKENVK